MNKQQLANKIWASANKMRSKIEANEYKDYILGFVFYRFLSEQEEKYLLGLGYQKEDFVYVTEDKTKIVTNIQKNLGYFIAYENLYSTWLNQKGKFDVSNVRTALSAFERLISKERTKVFKDIFKTLETGLSKLGENAGKQTKSIADLLELIKDIPMDGKQGYDVLGFIYEYLIGMFAANAGKKAGEFYTPHEVSVLMSEIVAEHLKEKQEAKIYDPTSGSGSLLITIGKAMSKYINENKITYYAQELKENTYNLTRMNLVMRGIITDNIITRNGDTLEQDWPYFEEDHPDDSYDPLYVDAVVSNPPYSQQWEPKGKKNNPRFSDYGVAPKGKADFAFLLHDLYHIKPDGIMAIVLPHGVLFRGNEEETIRKALIEKNKIDTIIGLPENIFFGTGIPTIIMVLKQNRENTDTLIIDASKYFTKEGKSNKLQASDIKRITDTIKSRATIPGYSKVVTKEEIRENNYNLNIPRYVDSNEKPESWDIYASMFGGIPKEELAEYNTYWKTFPTLMDDIFIDNGTPYMDIKAEDIENSMQENSDVKSFKQDFRDKFSNINDFLKNELFTDVENVNINAEEEIISDAIFERLKGNNIIDKYKAYQILDNLWHEISNDLEIISTEGFSATRQIDPIMVLKTNKEEEVQDGWKGRILPFELVQEHFLFDELQEIYTKEHRLIEISQEYSDIIDSIGEDEQETLLNENKDSFVNAEIDKFLNAAFEDIETDELSCLKDYRDLLANKAKKNEKLAFISSHQEVRWSNMEASKDGTYSKAVINSYVGQLQSEYTFADDSLEARLIRVQQLQSEEKSVKSELKQLKYELEVSTIDTINNLTDGDVYFLLEEKWIAPLEKSLLAMPNEGIADFTKKIVLLANKYKVTYREIIEDINVMENSVADMIDDLTGNDFDMKGLNEFQKLLRGNVNE